VRLVAVAADHRGEARRLRDEIEVLQDVQDVELVRPSVYHGGRGQRLRPRSAVYVAADSDG